MGASCGSCTSADSFCRLSSVANSSVWNPLESPMRGRHPGILYPCASSVCLASSFPNPDHSAITAIPRTYISIGDAAQVLRALPSRISDDAHSDLLRDLPGRILPRSRRGGLLFVEESLHCITERVPRRPSPCRTESPSFPRPVSNPLPLNWLICI